MKRRVDRFGQSTHPEWVHPALKLEEVKKTKTNKYLNCSPLIMMVVKTAATAL